MDTVNAEIVAARLEGRTISTAAARTIAGWFARPDTEFPACQHGYPFDSGRMLEEIDREIVAGIHLDPSELGHLYALRAWTEETQRRADPIVTVTVRSVGDVDIAVGPSEPSWSDLLTIVSVSHAVMEALTGEQFPTGPVPTVE